MGKTVRGFGPDEEQTRALIVRYNVSGDVEYRKDQKLKARVLFETANINYHQEENMRGRPFIELGGGRVISIYSDNAFIFDVDNIRFTREKAPMLDVVWELNNEEIIGLIQKGILGFDYDIDSSIEDYLKPRQRISIPPAFLEAQWTDIPVELDIYGVMGKNSNGVDIPIIGISEIKDRFGLKTNSYVTDYQRIDQYFAQPDFFEKGYDQAMRDMYASVEILHAIGEEQQTKNEAEAQAVSKDGKILSPHVYTEEEKLEMEKIAMLEFERDSLVESKLDERNVERQLSEDLAELEGALKEAEAEDEDTGLEGQAVAEDQDDQYIRIEPDEEDELVKDISDEELAEYSSRHSETEDEKLARLKISQMQAVKQNEAAVDAERNEAAINDVMNKADYLSMDNIGDDDKGYE